MLSCCRAAPLVSAKMWWLSIAWLLIGATITNVVVWTPLLLDAALSGDFSGQLKARRVASSDLRAEVCVFAKIHCWTKSDLRALTLGAYLSDIPVCTTVCPRLCWTC